MRWVATAQVGTGAVTLEHEDRAELRKAMRRLDGAGFVSIDRWAVAERADQLRARTDPLALAFPGA